MSFKSSEGSQQRKTLKQCYQCKQKGHIAHNCWERRKILSLIEKGKETERRVNLQRQNLAKEKDRQKNVLNTCPHSSSPCQACECHPEFAKPPQKDKDKSSQQVKIVEIGNKCNPVKPTKAHKWIQSKEEGEKVSTPGFQFKDENSNEEEEIIEYSHHNIHGENIINSEGNQVPSRKKSSLVNQAEVPKLVEEEKGKSTHHVMKITKCNSDIDESESAESDSQMV